MMRQRQTIVLLILVLGVLLISVYVFFSRPKIQAATPSPASVAVNTNTPGVSSTSDVLSPIASSTRVISSSIVTATQTRNAASLTSATADKNTPLPISPTENQSTPVPTQIEKVDASLPFLMIVELQPESPMVGGQAVWISNPSDATVDIGCWTLRSAISGNTVIVEPNLRLPAETVVMLIPKESWLGVRDQIQLLDRLGHPVDQTPELIDNAFDDQLWYRNANGQWSFGRTQINANVIQGHVSMTARSGC